MISSIIHIAHEYDNDAVQWPIQIEDHDSNMHSVNLKPGQVRESPKEIMICLILSVGRGRGTCKVTFFLW